MDRKPGRPRALTVEMIAQAALDDGISSFSMPSVARRLGVAHSGLYRYVTNREDLLLQAVDHALRRWTWPSAELPWDQLLRELGDTLWNLCEEHPGFDVAATNLQVPSYALREIADGYVQSLRRQGFTQRDASVAIEFVMSLAMTSSVLMKRIRGMQSRLNEMEQPVTAYATEEFYTGRGSYDQKLEITIAGLATRLTQGS